MKWEKQPNVCYSDHTVSKKFGPSDRIKSTIKKIKFLINENIKKLIIKIKINLKITKK